MSLLSRRLNIVTGKGGVGKSTVSAALALAAQARGQRVLVCEVTAHERVSGLLGSPESGTEIRRVDERIWSVHVEPQSAMREYGLMVLRFKAVYSAVFENRLVRYFLKAIPSLPEIVMLGKIWWHVTQDRDESGRLRWDQVIVDAPATGHGLSFLRTPRTILEIVSEGPLVRDMKRMQEMLVDPATTAVSIVTLPEEMPANEAAEMHAALANELRLPLGRLLLNAWVAPRFSPDERTALAEVEAPELGAAKEATLHYAARQDLSLHYGQRLEAEVALPMTRLPWLAGSAFGRAEVERLATILGAEV
jgi:anion-transporting  ArsA/GET3 family ATPase